MKNLFIIFIILAFCFIAQILYMGNFNEKIFNELSRDKNSDYKITNLNFEKGFLHSKASFTLEDTHDLNLSSMVYFNFNNNYFSDFIAEGNLSNPFKLLKENLKDNKLADLIIRSKNNRIQLLANFQDINLSNEGGDTLLNNALLEILMNKNAKIKNINLKIDKAEFSQFYEKLSINNFNYKQTFENPISPYYLTQLKEGVEEISFDSLMLNNNKLNSFYTKNILKFNDDNQTLKIIFNGKMNNVSLDFSSKIYQNLDLDKIHFNIILDKIIKDYFNKFDFNSIIEKGLDFKTQNLTIEKNKQNIEIKINANTFKKHYKSEIQILTPKAPDEIFTWGQFFGGLNQYFIANENGFIMNLIYDNLAKPELKINGNEFSNIDFN